MKTKIKNTIKVTSILFVLAVLIYYPEQKQGPINEEVCLEFSADGKLAEAHFSKTGRTLGFFSPFQPFFVSR